MRIKPLSLAMVMRGPRWLGSGKTRRWRFGLA